MSIAGRRLAPHFAGLAVLSFVAASPGQPAPALKPAGLTDAYGDPLPAGAVARLGTLRLWHGAAVSSLALSPDGKVLASGGGDRWRRAGGGSWYGKQSDGEVHLWDLSNGRKLCTLKAEQGTIDCLAFSPDGRLLAAGCGCTVFTWEAASGKLLRQFYGGKHPVRLVTFSPDGRRLQTVASARDHWSTGAVTLPPDRVQLWDVATGKLLRTRGGPIGEEKKLSQPAKGETLVETLVPVAVAQSANGRRSAWCFRRQQERREGNSVSIGDGVVSLKFYDAASGQQVHQVDGLPASVNVLALSLDGRRFATAGDDSISLGLTEPPGGALLWIKGVGRAQLAFSPDGKVLASRHDCGVCLWSAGTAKTLRHWFLVPANGCGAMDEAPPPVFSAKGRVLAAAFGGFLHVWDLRQGKEQPAFPGRRRPVTNVRFSAEGPMVELAATGFARWSLGSACKRGKASAWPTLSKQGPWAAESENRWHYLDRTENKTFRLCEGVGRTVLHTLPADTRAFESGDMSSDGRGVCLCRQAKDECALVFYEVPTAQELGRLKVKCCPEDFAVFPPARLAAWMEDGKTCLADLCSGKVRELPGGAGPSHRFSYTNRLLAFSPDGQTLLAAYQRSLRFAVAESDDGAVCLWDVATGKELQRLDVRHADGSPAGLCAAAFSPDGRTLAAAAYGENGIDLWEVATGQVRRRLPGHQDQVLCLDFSPDGRFLVSGSDDGTALVWDLVTPAPLPGQDGPAAAGLERWWSRLGSPDASRADEARRMLVAASAQSVSLLARRLRPATTPAAARLTTLIAELEAERYAVREHADRELAKLHELAGPALAKALARPRALESKRRLEKLLGALDNRVPPAPLLRQLRALEVLEQIGTPEAHRLLARLAGGIPQARLTREAQAALARLDKRPAGGR
jgi:WD40 repeat protein